MELRQRSLIDIHSMSYVVRELTTLREGNTERAVSYTVAKLMTIALCNPLVHRKEGDRMPQFSEAMTVGLATKRGRSYLIRLSLCSSFYQRPRKHSWPLVQSPLEWD